MRYIVYCCIFCFLSFTAQAQTDLPETQPLNLGTETSVNLPDTPTPKSNLKMPSVIDESMDLEKKKGISMLPNRDLKQAGHNLKLSTKIGEQEKGGAGKHFGDMYLGDISTGAKYVGIVCRDHEYVDGDRIKIWANEKVVDPNVLLTGSFQGINVDLQEGFNRLDFEALNQGSSGPNTAQVDVYDEKGELIFSNIWNLSTGSKASLVIVKKSE